ncbi:serine/threonine-protein kinase DDB_G0283821 isoform X4 [Drosophila hydei]|nr:serine/threonine-protein kinase DDB_G0283821 isoform X4 [Drosophila hydei]
MDSFDISSEEEEALLEEIVVGNGSSCHMKTLQRLQHWHSASASASSSFTRTQHRQQYEPTESPIHYCDHAALYSDDNAQEQPAAATQPTIRCSSSSQSNLAIETEQYDDEEPEGEGEGEEDGDADADAVASGSGAGGQHRLHTSFNHQLTADMCNYKNSKSRRLEYSLKCLKYGRSNPSQDSAFGSLTDNDLSIGSSSIRLNSFQSISSPIDEGVEDVIIATTTGGNETCLELATIPRSMVSQDSAISSPCRESSPSNFLHIDDAMSGTGSTSSGSGCASLGNIRPQHFPVSLSPKILVTATSNSSSSSLASTAHTQQQQQQQFDPPKILVNDQNSIYTTSPSKRSSMIEVFSQKYRVSSFEDMSPKRSSSDKHHLKHVNRLAFRSLEEERRIDNAFMPMSDRTHSDNRVNMQSEKYKKLTHASFRISKTSSSQDQSSPTNHPASCNMELQRTGSSTGSQRQTLWRDSKFYRKNRIAKSNDSLLDHSPNHSSARLSPGSQGSRRSLSVTTSFCGQAGQGTRRYCSSKSEDLGETSDYLRVMDARKSYSERHLVRLKQTAINNMHSGSEDEMSFNDDNNASSAAVNSSSSGSTHGYQQQQQMQLRWSSCSINHLKTTNIKTTSLATLTCQTNLSSQFPPTAKTASYRTPSKSLDQALDVNSNTNSSNSNSNSSSNNSSKDNSSVDESPSRQTLSGAELSRIFVMDMDDAPGSSCSEEKTPLLDSVEMSPISPTEPQSELKKL